MQTSNRQTSWVLIFAAAILITAGGIAEGLMTHRWLPNTAVSETVNLLKSVPATIGEWHSEDLPLTNVDLQVGGIAGYVQRTYTDRQTGAKVFMLLVTGEAGPISVHPPTACFSGRGFHVVGQQKFLAVEDKLADRPADSKHLFHAADFSNTAVDDASLTRVYWAWSGDAKWQAPDNARMKFAGEPALYKLYISERWIPTGDSRQDAGAAKNFMAELLPELSRILNRTAVN